jgi:hypothetical protein
MKNQMFFVLFLIEKNTFPNDSVFIYTIFIENLVFYTFIEKKEYFPK